MTDQTIRQHLNQFTRYNRSRNYALILTSNVIIMAMIGYAEIQDVYAAPLIRYLALLPIGLTAFSLGMLPAQINAAYYSIAILTKLYGPIWQGAAFTSLSTVIGYILFLHVFAYIIADTTRTLQSQTALESREQSWKSLLAHILDQDEVVHFLLENSIKLTDATDSIVIFKNPLTLHWEVVSALHHNILPDDGSPHSLGHWLLSINQPLLLNKLTGESSTYEGYPPLRSLISCPMLRSDGRLFGNLTVFNCGDGEEFSNQQLINLTELAKSGERALEQAGFYTLAHFELGARVNQMAIIERAIREFNSNLDPGVITRQTLNCALQISGGRNGFIYIPIPGQEPIECIQDTTIFPNITDRVSSMVTHVDHLVPYTDVWVRKIFPELGSKNGFLAPIHVRSGIVGLLSVDSATGSILGESVPGALAILTDQAAIALENAHLIQELTREKQELNQVVQSIADGLFTTDTNGVILSANPAAETLTGWKPETMKDRNVCEVLSCKQAQDCLENCSLMHSIAETREMTERRLIRTRLGMKRVIQLRTAPLIGGNQQIIGSAVLFNDITKQDEIEQLHRQIIAAVSHDIRTPLANIITTADMLHSELPSDTLTNVRQYLDCLIVQSQRLTTFFDKIMDIDRIESGRYELQCRPLPLDAIAAQVVQQWQTIHPSRRFILHAANGVWAWIDETALHSVLDNLLDNAVKYSPPESAIEVHVQITKDGQAGISVIDYGPGISAEHQPRLFDRFYRVRAGDAQIVYGHGLGLYVAKSYVDSMGGQIWVQSDEGKGSKFTISFPVLESAYDEKDPGH